MLPWSRLRQPDGRSCGAACLVVARMLADPAYRDVALPAFGPEVRSVHARVVGWWPRALGTPPWAVARHLPGGPHSWRPTRGRFDEVAAAGAPVAVYVGNAWLPRHVVLVLDADERGWRAYDPGRGRVVRVTREQVATRRLPFGRWDRVWFVVLPAPQRSSAA